MNPIPAFRFSLFEFCRAKDAKWAKEIFSLSSC